MIDRRELARALNNRKNVAYWAVIQRDQELGVIDEAAPGTRRREHRTRWQLTVHADTPHGRGSANVAIDALDGDADKVVDQLVALAETSAGPVWPTLPPAAPARVELVDLTLAQLDPLAISDAILRKVVRPAGATVIAAARNMREHVRVLAHAGFATSWDASHLWLDTFVIANGHAMTATREARTQQDLDVDAPLGTLADLVMLAAAGSPTAGPCTLVIGADAMLHGHDGLGMWWAFAAQADAVVARQGLTRYHEHAPIVPGADQVPDPLSIESDGALSYGVRSAPLGDEGDAVRRFSLVDRGIAAGLGLSPREAGLRGRDPNGGVRNLIVSPGSWTPDLQPTGGRIIEVRRLRDLEIDPYTGEASLDIALAVEHAPGAEPRPFSSGTFRLDLIGALARARRSTARIRRGPYVGPTVVAIENAELIV